MTSSKPTLLLILAALLGTGAGCAESRSTRDGPLFEKSTPRYAVAVHRSGADGGALELTPVPPYKLATEFPIRLTLAPDAPSERVLQSQDAIRYSETGAAFEWAPSESAPIDEIEFAFGVCETNICEPIELRIALADG